MNPILNLLIFSLLACLFENVLSVPEPKPNGSGTFNVNVVIIPAIKRQSCTRFARWIPTDIQCAECFCVFNGISRCYPRRGCRPTFRPQTTTAGSTLPTNSSAPIIVGGSAPSSTATTTVAGSSTQPEAAASTEVSIAESMSTDANGVTEATTLEASSSTDPTMAAAEDATEQENEATMEAEITMLEEVTEVTEETDPEAPGDDGRQKSKQKSKLAASSVKKRN